MHNSVYDTADSPGSGKKKQR